MAENAFDIGLTLLTGMLVGATIMLLIIAVSGSRRGKR